MNDEKFTPNCRYGHGDLIKAPKPLVANYTKGKYGYSADGGNLFVGDLFVCPRCGYTELFDDEVDVTVQAAKAEMEPR